MNLTEGPVFKKLIAFVLPIMATSFLQQLYITLGSMIVGSLGGKEQLAAIGATASLTNLLLNFFIGLSVGATVTCAKYYGSNDRKMLDKAVHTSIMLALFSGVMLAVVGSFFAKPLLVLMGTPKDTVLMPATWYMIVFFLGSPFSMLYNFGAGVLRASGDTKRPLFILSISGIINIIVSYICVGFLKLGVVGAALGTVSSQMFSSVLVLRILVRSERTLNLRLKDIRFHKEPLLNMLKVGIPAGINSMLFSLANVFMQSTINNYDEINKLNGAYIAGSAAGTNVENFIFLVMNAIEQAIVSYVGQNYGAKKYKRIDRVVLCAHGLGVITTVLMSLFVLWKTDFLLSLFNNSPEVIKAGRIRLDIVCKTCLAYLPTVLISGALKGMERSTLPTMINILFICATRILWITFIFPINPTFEMIYYCFPISWGMASFVQCIAYFLVRIKTNSLLKRERALEEKV